MRIPRYSGNADVSRPVILFGVMLAGLLVLAGYVAARWLLGRAPRQSTL